MPLVTQKQLADFLNVSPQAVHAQLKPGKRLDGLLRKDRKMDRDAAVIAWKSLRRPRVIDAADDGEQGEYQRARAKKEKHAAEMGRLKTEQLAGTLLDRELVQRFVLAAHAAAITRLRGMPAQWSDGLASITDTHEMRIKLEEIAVEIANLIADDIEGIGS